MLKVEIADNPLKQAKGLMFRKALADDGGMIFIFKDPQKLSFWGLNTYIPLDIAFVNPHNRIVKISHIKPLSTKSVESEKDCRIAIEANLGFFEEHKIRVGDTISFKRITDRVGCVDFSRQKFAQIENSPPQKISPDDLDPDKVIPQVDNQQNPPQQGNLPVVNISDLDQILEDSFDEGEQIGGPELQQEPQPEISPEQLETEQPEPFEIPDEEYPDFATPEEALTWAEQNDEVVRIWYTTKRGRDIEREVEPHGQFMAQGTGNLIVVTYDETIGGIRAFLVDNILYNSFVGRQFTPKFTVAG
jgi:uncharacterized membrane protein (UPF0127 family)